LLTSAQGRLIKVYVKWPSCAKSNALEFDQMAQIIRDDVAHCGISLQTFNTLSGDQLYMYYRYGIFAFGTFFSKWAMVSINEFDFEAN
jgi:hypothetical protein